MPPLASPPVNVDLVEVTMPYGWLNILLQVLSPLVAAALTWWITAWRYRKDKNDLVEANRAAKKQHEDELAHQKTLHEAELEEIRANSKLSRQQRFLDEASALIADVSASAQAQTLNYSHVVSTRRLAARVFTIFYGEDRGFAHFSHPAFNRLAHLVSAAVDRVDRASKPIRSDYLRFADYQLADEAARLSIAVAQRADPRLAAESDSAIERFGLTPTFEPTPGS